MNNHKRVSRLQSLADRPLASRNIAVFLFSIYLALKLSSVVSQPLTSLQPPFGTRYLPPDTNSTAEGTPRIRNIGDVNSDGLGDFGVCHPAHSLVPGQGGADGQCYIVFGQSTFPSEIPLLNGKNGFSVRGRSVSSFGENIAGVGDVSGDGIDDFAISAYTRPPLNQGGVIHLVYGRSSGFPPTLDLSTQNAIATEFRSSYNAFGNDTPKVAGVGDVNGDNRDDFVIGTPRAGRAHLILGRGSAFPPIMNLDSNETSIRIESHVTNYLDFLGDSISGLDFNGDGLSDIAVAAPYYRSDTDGLHQAGRVYIIAGRSDFPASITTSGSGVIGGTLVRSSNVFTRWLGLITRNAGDINGDGVGDLLIDSTSTTINPNPRVHVVYGTPSMFPATIDVSNLNGLNGTQFAGLQNSVFSADAAGDVNGDGHDDLIIGDRHGPGRNGLQFAGRAFLIYGRSSSTAEVRLYPGPGSEPLPKALGLTFFGEQAFDGAGRFVSGASDLNGDTYSDILISSRSQTTGGVVYVRLGRDLLFEDKFE